MGTPQNGDRRLPKISLEVCVDKTRETAILKYYIYAFVSLGCTTAGKTAVCTFKLIQYVSLFSRILYLNFCFKIKHLDWKFCDRNFWGS